nr:hypothetical protein [Brevibacillus laterosporus]
MQVKRKEKLALAQPYWYVVDAALIHFYLKKKKPFCSICRMTYQGYL